MGHVCASVECLFALYIVSWTRPLTHYLKRILVASAVFPQHTLVINGQTSGRTDKTTTEFDLLEQAANTTCATRPKTIRLVRNGTLIANSHSRHVITPRSNCVTAGGVNCIGDSLRDSQHIQNNYHVHTCGRRRRDTTRPSSCVASLGGVNWPQRSDGRSRGSRLFRGGSCGAPTPASWSATTTMDAECIRRSVSVVCWWPGVA